MSAPWQRLRFTAKPWPAETMPRLLLTSGAQLAVTFWYINIENPYVPIWRRYSLWNIENIGQLKGLALIRQASWKGNQVETEFYQL
jgi:hypothetical protein